MVEAAGARLVQHPSVIDDFEATRAAVERGLEGDILIVSGGVSVGPHDHVKPAFEALRRRRGLLARADQARQAAVVRAPRPHARVRPAGQPAVGDRLHGAVRPARRCASLRGEADPGPRFDRGRLGEPAGPSDNRTTFLISKLVPGADGVLEAWPTERQGSHMTGALGESDGFAVAPHGSGPLAVGRRGGLAAGVAVNSAPMGLMGDWLRGKRMKDPVRGTAQVVACSRMTQAAVARTAR